MKFNYIKRGYTLAEIMIVLLVLTIIFAAFAPMFTKRAMTSTRGKYAVWGYVDQDELNAFTFPGDANNYGQLFFGTSPMTKDAVENEFLPLSKIVIRSNTIDNKFQRHIQFRYGRTSVTDGGKFAGTWSVINNNILLGAGFNKIDNKINFFGNEIDGLDPTTGARNNVAVGYNALNSLVNAKNNVAIGYGALNSLVMDFEENVSGVSLKNPGSKNVAVGYMAGSKLTNSKNNIMIGAEANGGVTSSHDNTLIGYSAGYKTSGSYNTYIGHKAGYNGGGSDNVAIGDQALSSLSSSSTNQYNVAIGAGALKNLTKGSNNVALGYGACSEITNSSNKTCIGYNAGPHSNSSAASVTKAMTDGDTTYRTYIGSKPSNYGGDAVLEIHNLSTVSPGISAYLNSHLSNTTTVINGNLVVKGRPYFTVGNTLQHFHDGTRLYNESNAATIYGYGSAADANYASCSGNIKTYYFNTKCIQMTSDRKLKNITTRSSAGLNEINKLKIYNFNFKNDPNKLPQVGVMAQDLMKVFPNSVFKDDNGYLKIKWDEMFYAAINAIKELDRKVIALVNRTTKVESQISKLEKENIILKSQVDNLTLRVNKLKAQ